MAVTRRVYLYAIAFVALGMLVGGLSSLLETSLAVLLEPLARLTAILGTSLLRDRISFAGAVAVIGLIAWLAHWLPADRSARRHAAERRAAIRKLFLYAVLGGGALLLAAAGRGLLTDLLLALFGRLTWPSVLTGAIVRPFAVLAVAGPIWLYYARVTQADRMAEPEVGAGATLRRWCLYALSFVGLLQALFAAVGLLQALWEAAVVPPGVLASGAWLPSVVPGAVGSLVAGLALWTAAWTASTAAFDRADAPDPERRSVLRKVYLYLVLAIAVAWTVWNIGRVLYQVLRALLIPEQLAGGWGALAHDLGGPGVAVLVFGLAWAYHARVVAREAATSPERRQQATIRWLYAYLVTFIGLVALGVGLGGTLATLLDLLVQPAAVRSTHWWEERVSLFTTLVVVGLPLWAAYWRRLQHEAREPLARDALVRRIYLFLVFGLTVLTLLTSGAFTLYQGIRRALGDPGTPGATSDLVAAASAVLLAAVFLLYHVRVYRTPPLPGAMPAPPPAAPSTFALALVRAPDATMLAALQRDLQARAPAGVEVYLLPLDPATAARLAAVAQRD